MNKSYLLLLVSFLSANTFAEVCSKEITMTGNPQYPPITFIDKNKKLSGSYIEFTKNLLSYAGYQSKSIHTGNWRRAQEEVKEGRIDMLIGPWFNKERAKWLVYVEPEVSLDPAAIFINSNHPFPFKSLTDLKGHNGTIQRGNSFGEAFDELSKSELKVEEVSALSSAFLMLDKKRTDYVVAGLYAGNIKISKLGLSSTIKPLKPWLTNDKMYIAFSKKSPCKELAEVLGKMIQDNSPQETIESLNEKYTKEILN